MQQNDLDYSSSRVKEVVDNFPGAKGWWASVFLTLGWNDKEVRQYLETSSLDAKSPLRQEIDARLGRELKVYAGSRGLDIGESKVVEQYSDGRITYKVRQVMSMSDQDTILREVSGIARLEFVPTAGHVYVDHVVAKVICQVTYSWLRRMVPRKATVLEVGASIPGMLLAAVDCSRYHAYVPVLGPRDSVRHSVDRFVSTIVKGESRGYTASQQRVAMDYVANPAKYCTQGRIEDDDRKAEYIISNHSDYDIDLDDVPGIMAKHGARAWFGTIMRVKGLSSKRNVEKGEIPVLAARYVVDKEKDEISFHFRGRATFSYIHKYSSYVKREERNDYRWSGMYHDYVYTKLPTSTDSILMYAIFRVRREAGGMSEFQYAPTGQRGLVNVRSVRASNSAGRWHLIPCEFVMERLALDKVLEYRRSLGTKGNVVSTLAYMRSVRVRFYINGVAVGIEHSMDVETFESAAVFVELYVTASRLGSERDFSELMDVYSMIRGQRSLVDSLAYAVRSSVCSRVTGHVAALKRWREATEKALMSMVDLNIGMRNCDEFVCVGGRQSSSLVRDSLEGAACVCREYRDASVALESRAYSASELDALRVYRKSLADKLDECSCYDEFEDAVSFCSAEEYVSSGATSTAVEDDDGEEFQDCSEVNLEEKSLGVEKKQEFVPVVNTMVEVESRRADAIREYSGLMRFQYDTTVVESLRMAAMVFADGVPTEFQLARFATARCVPYVVRVDNGRLVRAMGKDASVDVAAIVDVVTMKLVEVSKVGSHGRRDVQGVSDGWHYSSSVLRLMNGYRLAEAASETLAGKFAESGVHDMHLSFVEGAFGCGKTRRIVREMTDLLRAGKSVAYLSATTSSVSRVVKDLCRAGLLDEEMNRVCRTLDSYLLHGVATYDVLYVDEAPMAHAGQIFACLAKMHVSDVRMFGDFQQIPFCSFTTEYLTPLQALNDFVVIEERMLELHRCPSDVLAAWTDCYQGGLTACKCCEDVRGISTSMSVIRIRDASEIPRDKDTRYLVFTHADKARLYAALGETVDIEVLRHKPVGGLATVHEDQGGTHVRVVLARLTARYDKKESPEAPSIYNRVPYALVATTRHTQKFSYYTISEEEDAVCKRVKLSRDRVRVKQVLGT